MCKTIDKIQILKWLKIRKDSTDCIS